MAKPDGRALLETPKHYRRRLQRRAGFLSGILSLALDGQHGTSAWGVVIRRDPAVIEGRRATKRAVLTAEGRASTVEVTLDGIEQALALVASFKAQIPGAMAATIRYADAMDDLSQLDAEDADVLVQIAIFGSVQYP